MVFKKGHKSGFTGHHWSEESRQKVILAKKGRRTSIKSEFKKGHPFLGTSEGIEKMKKTYLSKTHYHICPQCKNKYKRKSKKQIYCNVRCMSLAYTGRKLPIWVKEKMRGRITSEETRKKLSIAHRGLHAKEKHPNWKGGITDLKIKRELLAGRKMPTHCECCNKESILVFDHNHKTGKFRGWICNRCNLALGHINDSVSKLRLLIDYLKKTDLD